MMAGEKPGYVQSLVFDVPSEDITNPDQAAM